MPNNKQGFTLIELLVVISLIGTMASIILASLVSAREKGRIGASIMFADNMYQGWGADAIGYWKFDEASGDALDSGPNNITLVKNAAYGIARSPITPLSGGNSLDFTGSGMNDATSFVSADLSTKQLSMTKYTVDVWVLMPDASAQGVAVSVYDINNKRINALNFSGGASSATLVAGACLGSSYNYQPPFGKWINMAYSWDGANEKLYIDGKPYGSFLGCSPLGGISVGWIVKNIYVSGYSGIGAHFIGRMDNLVIYNNTLSNAQIEQIYAEGLKTHTLAER